MFKPKSEFVKFSNDLTDLDLPKPNLDSQHHQQNGEQGKDDTQVPQPKSAQEEIDYYYYGLGNKFVARSSNFHFTRLYGGTVPKQKFMINAGNHPIRDIDEEIYYAPIRKELERVQWCPIRIGYSIIGRENPLMILIMVVPGCTEYEKVNGIIDAMKRYVA
jgi:hypothetical protein